MTEAGPGASPPVSPEAGAPVDALYAAEVRDTEALWRSRGITAVPAVAVEGKWLISGGQPAGVFEEALRGMAREA